MEFMPTVFAKGRKWQSYAIRGVTWSRWSHNANLHYGELFFQGRLYTGTKVLEAVGGVGVIVTPWAEFLKRYDEDDLSFGLVPVIDSLDAAYERLISQLGKGYDYKMLVGNLIRSGWDDPEAWSCSEYTAYGSGIYRHDRLARVTPEKVWCNAIDWHPMLSNPIYPPAIIKREVS